MLARTVTFPFPSVIAKGFHKVSAWIYKNRRPLMIMLCLVCVLTASADGGDMTTTGVSAFGQVTESLKKYIQPVRALCYALAGIVAIGGGISVYIKMNNEEQDVKKSIMMIVGACIFLIAAATFLPKFFGVE